MRAPRGTMGVREYGRDNSRTHLGSAMQATCRQSSPWAHSQALLDGARWASAGGPPDDRTTPPQAQAMWPGGRQQFLPIPQTDRRNHTPAAVDCFKRSDARGQGNPWPRDRVARGPRRREDGRAQSGASRNRAGDARGFPFCHRTGRRSPGGAGAGEGHAGRWPYRSGR